MSEEFPTLKVRFALDKSALGLDCNERARQIAGADGLVTVLDSKWGREPTKWRESGGGWGRNTTRLTDEERGYVTACHSLVSKGSVEARLVAIIERLTNPYPGSIDQ